jgi:hypothetical protein
MIDGSEIAEPLRQSFAFDHRLLFGSHKSDHHEGHEEHEESGRILLTFFPKASCPS